MSGHPHVDAIIRAIGRLKSTMAGMTRVQYQEEKARRLIRRRARLTKRVKVLLGRVERLDRQFADQPLLTFDQHRELEQTRDSLLTNLDFLNPKAIMAAISEIRLDMVELTLKRCGERLTKLEKELAS